MIFFSDLDGTLLNSSNKFNEKDIFALKFLKKMNFFRVIATGRHIFSSKKVLKNNFPIDFLIFSTGAGILNWKTDEIIYKTSLSKQKINDITQILISQNVCFSIHKDIPQDHFFYSFQPVFNKDFQNRNKIYKNFYENIDNCKNIDSATRIIAILSDKEEDFIKISNKLYSEISDIKIIRASSPINGKNIWLEIYPLNVSKGNTAKWLCDYLKVDYKNTFGLGNDYNDIDLLNFTFKSYVVENAPNLLKSKYKTTASNDKNGLFEIINKHFDTFIFSE